MRRSRVRLLPPAPNKHPLRIGSNLPSPVFPSAPRTLRRRYRSAASACSRGYRGVHFGVCAGGTSVTVERLMPLTSIAIRNAKARRKPYKLADEKGLYLLVKPDGSRYWRFKYRFGGKEKLLALGIADEVTVG